MVNVPPVSGFIPDAIGASQRLSVTGWLGRASGMPPAPVGVPPPAPLSAGVVVPQAARMPDMPESETAAPPDRRRKSRRVVARRRSFGCMKLSLLNRLASQARVERRHELGHRVEDDPIQNWIQSGKW